MKTFFSLIILTFSFQLIAQQSVVVISRCGGVDIISIPNITDNDHDGMDDALEQKLLNYFMPAFIQFDDESCPGPALNGTGDSNLVVCHIYPYPAQYTSNNNLNSVITNPVALIPEKGLLAGLVWYNPLIIVNAALLYGNDCGLLGHTADVEGFSFSLKYIGADSLAGWMYDTTLAHWMGGTLQTVSHAGTLCEQIETSPYKSSQFPNGLNTIYASPDKHGNYLTINGCGSSFICNPGCGGTPSAKTVKPINIGEPNAPLVSDLGTIYPAYVGNDPWSTAKFLNSQGGNAGAIRDKMIKPLTSDFIQGQVLTVPQICPLYEQCFGPSGFAYSDHVCAGAYTFYNQQLTASGTYSHPLSNSYGCDSIITITLTLTVADTLYSHSVTVCEGSQYEFNGELFDTPGVYVDTFAGAFGCDSTVMLSLAFASLPDVTWIGNTDTVWADINAVPLNGGHPAGGVYWGNGVSGTQFYPDVAGIGTHLITYTFTDSLGCSNSVSKAFIVVPSSGIEEGSDHSILIFPNPAHDKIHFIFPLNITLTTAVIYDARGVLIKKLALNNDFPGYMIITDLPKGIYMAEFVTKNNVFYKRFMVE